MAFPQSPLPIKVELKTGSVWTDITSDVRGEPQIRITRGRSSEGQLVDTSRCALTLENPTGKYSPRNATGPLYGLIGRNTPVRVSVMTGTPYLDLPGTIADFASTPDTAALDITGDLDVRVDCSLSNWLTAAGNGAHPTMEIIGKLADAPQKSWLVGTQGGRIYLEWSPDGTNTLNATSTIPPVIPGSGRLCVRATLDVDNGSGGWTVRFFTAATLDSPFTQLGDPVTGSGITSIYNSTSPLSIGNVSAYAFNLPLGRCHAAEVRSGLWGTVVAQPRFNQQTIGAASFVDAAGRTWTMNGGAQITNRQTRFLGEASEWPIRWSSRYDAIVQLEASGVMRRLTQGVSPARSPMYREFTNPARTGIVAYWPMEDEAAATGAASAVPGQPAMTYTPGGVTPAAYTDWVASAPLPTFTWGTATVRPTSYPATNDLFLRFFTAVPAAGVPSTDRLLSFNTSGTARTWSLFLDPAGNLTLRVYDADGTQIDSRGPVAFQINGVKRHIGIELTQVGANIDYRLIVIDLEATRLDLAIASTVTGTVAGYTSGAATEVRIGQNGELNGTAVGHLAIASASNAYAATNGALVGWDGETATERFFRLGVEENLPAFPASISDETLGVQGLAPLLDLMREAEAVDEGILCEGRDFLGLRLRDHVSLYNQQPALTIDYTGDDGLVTPLDPTDDDQAVRNDITVTRTGGSSTRRTLDTGALSTQAPPNGVGRYDDSLTRNLATDAQTSEHAGWLLHTGTWDETRYPVVRLNLAAAPHMIDAAAAVDIGDRIQILNPPPWLPPDTIDLMVQGYTETLDQFTWSIDYNCTPAGPWDVTWAGDASTATAAREFAWIDTDGSQLAAALTTTGTTATVSTTTGPVWTPNARDLPLDWRAGGEVMTVTAPGTLLTSNAFFDTDATGWNAQNSSISRSQTFVCPHPRAIASLRIAPNGSAVSGGAASALSPVGSVTPGVTYIASCWAFSVNGWTDLQPCVDWYTAAGAYISTGLGVGFTVSASVWTWLELPLAAPANASRYVVRARHGGTPPASAVWYVWALRLSQSTSSWLRDLFPRTSASGWGIAETGQTWASVGGGAATDYTVSSTYASHVLSTLNDTRRTGIAAPSADVDLYCDMTASAAATGDSLYGAITARMLDASNMYMLRGEFTTGGNLLVTIRKVVAGTQTQLGSTYTAPVSYAPGTFVRFRFQVIGSSLRAKVWRVGAPEPSAWHIDTTDTALTAANQIGTRSVRITGNTNAATVEVRYANYELINPQTYTVTRSQNRVIKAQAAGTAVALARPAYLAL